MLIEYVFAVSFLSLGVAGYVVTWILKQDSGTERMREISNAIKVGAFSWFSRRNSIKHAYRYPTRA